MDQWSQALLRNCPSEPSKFDVGICEASAFARHKERSTVQSRQLKQLDTNLLKMAGKVSRSFIPLYSSTQPQSESSTSESIYYFPDIRTAESDSFSDLAQQKSCKNGRKSFQRQHSNDQNIPPRPQHHKRSKAASTTLDKEVDEAQKLVQNRKKVRTTIFTNAQQC